IRSSWPRSCSGAMYEIDTRADIFALGAIGYELIAGKPLHAGAGHLDDAVMSRIVESSPAGGAAFRAQAGGQLTRVLRRATEPSLDRRYQSASELAEDLRRVLDGRPLDADDASAVRALAFYTRRHRLVAGAIILAFATLVAAMTMTLSASRATERALTLAESAREDAAQQALHSQRIAEFLKASFLGVDPEELGADLTLFDAIDYAAGRIHRDLADVPEVEADVRGAIGFVYRRHGRYADALEQIRIANRLHSSTLGPADPRTLGSAEELGYLTWLYEGDAIAALAELDRVLTERAQTPSIENDGLAWVHMKAAAIALAIDDPRLAIDHLERARPLLVDQYGDVYAARPMRQMAMAYLALGETDEASRLAEQALAMCEHAAEQEYIAERARLSLGTILAAQGHADEARTHLNTALVGFDLLFGEHSLEAATTHVQLAWLELEHGDPAQAQMHATRAVEIRGSLLAPQHPELLEAEAVRAVCIAATSTEYFDTLTAAFDTMERAYGPDHRESLRVLRTAVKLSKAEGDSHSTRRFADSLRVLEDRRIPRLNAANPPETNR
ncbi:MAG: tetratricopeptide repeat-containing protein kinase family protein, partial [Planctomycetota bacterium]